jgi:hypothetical protein
MMQLHWFWVVLGLDPKLPLPTVTRRWLKSLYDEQRAKLDRSGVASVYDVVRLNGAYSEAKRLVVD